MPPRKPPTPQRPAVTTCAHCYNALPDLPSPDVVQHPVFTRDGALDYIELAHRRCVPAWAAFDNWHDAQEHEWLALWHRMSNEARSIALGIVKALANHRSSG